MKVKILLPAEVLKLCTQEKILLLTEGFEHQRETDPENNRPLLTIWQVLPGDATDFEYYRYVGQETQRWLRYIGEEVLGEALVPFDTQKDYGRFWRVLFEVDESFQDDLDPTDYDYFAEPDRHGAHIRIQWNQGRGVVRVKARTLDLLIKMLGMAVQKILDR
jgi:hypothetical protein